MALACALACVPAGPAPSTRPGPPPLQAEPFAAGKHGEWEAFLLRAEVAGAEPAGRGVTRPLVLELDDGLCRARGLFKTVDQMAPPPADPELDDPLVADRWQYEVAAYRIDRLLDLDLVPVTVARRYAGRDGSLQLWIEDAVQPPARGADGRRYLPPPPWRDRMLAFDALIFNADRNPTNLLVGTHDGRLWLIDHSRAFRLHPFFPSTVEWRTLVLDDNFCAVLARLERTRLSAALAGLLRDNQVDALLVRRDRLLATACQEEGSRPSRASPSAATRAPIAFSTRSIRSTSWRDSSNSWRRSASGTSSEASR